MGEARRRREAAVPVGRAERLGRLGGMLAGIAGDAALGAIRRAAGRSDGSAASLLSSAAAQRLGETLAEMRGAAMKLGQLLSLQEDLLPPEFSEVLARLRNQADFMPEAQVRRVLARELGAQWETKLPEFDFDPIAAASIGQVHAARAQDGRDLAVKVQYPGVAKSITSDVDNLVGLVRLTRILPVELVTPALVAEVKRELRREADYEREARNTQAYRELLGDDPGAFVPAVHSDLSTRRVIASDRVRGLPIEDLRSAEHGQERRDRIGTRLIALVFRELFEFGLMQTDPNFGNYLFDPKTERVALIDFGAVRRLGKRFTGRYGALIDAAIGARPAEIEARARSVGFLDGVASDQVVSTFVEFSELFAEPLREHGCYDFSQSDLARRAGARGVEAWSSRQLGGVPPDVLFLHRKLAGSFLLCAHIGARVDCRVLYEQARKRGRRGTG